MMKVKQGVFAPLSNNCYLLTDETTGEAALVDCSEWNDGMQRLIGESKLKYILLTHGHFDHIGGVRAVKEKYGAQLVITKQDAPMLTDPRLSLGGVSYHRDNNAPDILIKDGDVIKLGETDIQVISTPGHTKGSVCYIADGCIFTGDTLFRCSCGRCDFPGGDEYEMLDSLRKLKALEGDYKVYPGHDALSTLEFERNNNPYMNM